MTHTTNEPYRPWNTYLWRDLEPSWIARPEGTRYASAATVTAVALVLIFKGGYSPMGIVGMSLVPPSMVWIYGLVENRRNEAAYQRALYYSTHHSEPVFSALQGLDLDTAMMGEIIERLASDYTQRFCEMMDNFPKLFALFQPEHLTYRNAVITMFNKQRQDWDRVIDLQTVYNRGFCRLVEQLHRAGEVIDYSQIHPQRVIEQPELKPDDRNKPWREWTRIEFLQWWTHDYVQQIVCCANEGEHDQARNAFEEQSYTNCGFVNRQEGLEMIDRLKMMSGQSLGNYPHFTVPVLSSLHHLVAQS